MAEVDDARSSMRLDTHLFLTSCFVYLQRFTKLSDSPPTHTKKKSARGHHLLLQLPSDIGQNVCLVLGLDRMTAVTPSPATSTMTPGADHATTATRTCPVKTGTTRPRQLWPAWVWGSQQLDPRAAFYPWRGTRSLHSDKQTLRLQTRNGEGGHIHMQN